MNENTLFENEIKRGNELLEILEDLISAEKELAAKKKPQMGDKDFINYNNLVYGLQKVYSLDDLKNFYS